MHADPAARRPNLTRIGSMTPVLRSVSEAIERFGDYIKTETLADDLATAAEVVGEQVEWGDGGVLNVNITRSN